MNGLPHPNDWPRMLRRRSGVFGAVLAVGLALALALALMLPARYIATARILIDAPQVSASLEAPALMASAADRLARLEQRLTARDPLLSVAERHGRFADQPELGRAERVERMREATRIEPLGFGPGRPGRHVAAFTISHTAADPVMAAAIANELVAGLLAANERERTGRVLGATAFFREELDRLGRALVEAEQEIADYKNAHEDALPASLALRRTALVETERRLEERAAERRALEAERRRLEAARERRLERGSDPQGLLAPGARRLAREVERIEGALALLDAADAPDRRRLSALRASLAATPEVEMTLAGLIRRRDHLEARHGLALSRQAEAEIAERIEINDQAERFEVIEQASPPEEPTGPPRALIAAGGALGALLFAFATALLAEARDGTIRCTADLERLAGLRPVVVVPPVLTAAERRHLSRRRMLRLAAAVVLIPLALEAAQRLSLVDIAGRTAAAAGLDGLAADLGQKAQR